MAIAGHDMADNEGVQEREREDSAFGESYGEENIFGHVPDSLEKFASSARRSNPPRELQPPGRAVAAH